MAGRVIAQGYRVVDEERHAVNYRSSVWGDYFIRNPILPHNYRKSLEWMTERCDDLIVETREMFVDILNPFAKMKLIDALQRLGVSYHFKEEIDNSLESLVSVKFANDDFHAISLQFRLLRQQRRYMPCDAFKEFIDKQGNLNGTLCSDTRALLALYEAAHLGTPNEEILREAQRLEARLYIPLYEEDKEECNEMILELAKLDFYLLQRLHREEVKEICEWYHGLESPRELFYARHRPAEAYFWALGVYYEPEYAKPRKLLAKFIATITPYDDTFDNYGLWKELQPFADVMQRWDEKGAEQLGRCYKEYAQFMFGTMNEIEGALPKGTPRKNVNVIKDIVMIWMSGFPQIVKDSCIVSRLMDDIVAHAFETERNNVATAVTCYMKEYDSTKEEAIKALWNDVENAWKDMNEEYLKLTSIPSSLLIQSVSIMNNRVSKLASDDPMKHVGPTGDDRQEANAAAAVPFDALTIAAVLLGASSISAKTRTLYHHRGQERCSQNSPTTCLLCRKPLESAGDAKGLPATNLLNHLHGQTPSPHLPKGSTTIVWKQTSQKRRGAPRRGRRPGWPKEELKVEDRSTKDVVVFYVTNEKLKGKRS
uniref:Terpene synthase N-terminal domain-containing protein n=1 Tax=Oryza barthii TaxID=65489 RepID=A0A0D3FK27_9ORYZ